jgi:hypothetical protein
VTRACSLISVVSYTDQDNLPVHVQSVVLLQLVRCTSDKLELFNWNTECLEDSFEEERVVFRPVLEGLEGGFVGIEETVQLGGQDGRRNSDDMTYVGQEDFYLSVSLQDGWSNKLTLTPAVKKSAILSRGTQ